MLRRGVGEKDPSDRSYIATLHNALTVLPRKVLSRHTVHLYFKRGPHREGVNGPISSWEEEMWEATDSLLRRLSQRNVEW